MPSLISRALPAYMRAIRASATYSDDARARALILERSLRPESFGVPKRLRKDVTVEVGRMQGWPVYTLAPRDTDPVGAVIYLHGGAWVHEIVKEHWKLIAQIAADARTSVVVPIYPLIPFATVADVVPQVAELIADCQAEYGPVGIGGDSAGGQIALSAALLARDQGLAPLVRTVLISPALDLTYSNPEIVEVAPLDPWLSNEGGDVFTELWLGDVARTNPIASPVLGDLHGLGPITLFSGTYDILHPDAKVLASKAAAAGVDIDYHEEPGLIHVYPLTYTPEGIAARRLICEQLHEALR